MTDHRPLACIGDCVVDVFRDRHLAYPGGNAYNVAAYSTLLHGARASFTGIVGDDRFGDHIVSVLGKLGVDMAGVRRAHGPSGQALVDVAADGDRVFVGSNRGGVQRGLSLRITPDDETRLRQSRLIHTSVYSGIDHLVPQLSQFAPVSYDFSEAPPLDSIVEVLAHVSVACFSGSRLSPDERDDFGRDAVSMGPRVVLITAGGGGAYAYTPDGKHQEPIVPTTVIDALGAGDSFISGFLHHWSQGASVASSMAQGARSGAAACRFEGAFGNPISVADEEIAALTVTTGPR